MRYVGGEYEELDDLEEIEAGGSLLLSSPPSMTFHHAANGFLFIRILFVLRNLVQPPLRLSSFVLRLLWFDHLI